VNRLVKQANGDMGISEAGATTDGEDDDEDAEDSTGFQEPEPINQEDEYIEEDKYTTVTIESVDISRAGFSVLGKNEDDATDIAGKAKGTEEQGKEGEGGIKRDANGKRIWTKERPKTEWPKKKKIKFRYESKADRKTTRFKQGARKRKQREARDKE
jgi:ribosomal RNA-processing protein 17